MTSNPPSQPPKPIAASRVARELAHLSDMRTNGELDRDEYEHRFSRMISELRERRIKLFGPRAAGSPPAGAAPGEIVATDPALLVATGDDLLQILDVQPEGKGRLAAAEWVRGRGAHPGDRFI